MISLEWWFKGKGCTSKRMYVSEKEAQEAVARDKKKYGDDMKVYRCRYCQNFHTAREKKP